MWCGDVCHAGMLGEVFEPPSECDNFWEYDAPPPHAPPPGEDTWEILDWVVVFVVRCASTLILARVVEETIAVSIAALA